MSALTIKVTPARCPYICALVVLDIVGPHDCGKPTLTAALTAWARIFSGTRIGGWAG